MVNIRAPAKARKQNTGSLRNFIVRRLNPKSFKHTILSLSVRYLVIFLPRRMQGQQLYIGFDWVPESAARWTNLFRHRDRPSEPEIGLGVGRVCPKRLLWSPPALD